MVSERKCAVSNAPPFRTTGMPPEMRLLVELYPRDGWQAHPNFDEHTRHWLGAHLMFRRLGDLVRRETERFLDRSRSPGDFSARLAQYGKMLVGNLHAHHGWEDQAFFPELSAADPRFDRGLEILEKDHESLDTALQRFVEIANRALTQLKSNETAARAKVGDLHTATTAIEAMLDRHLGDEEELAVPIILHHRLRK